MKLMKAGPGNISPQNQKKMHIEIYIYFYFSHLADAFIQSDLQWGHYKSNQNQQKSNNKQVLLQVLVSLTQYT